MTLYSIPEKISALIFDIDNTLYSNNAYLDHQIDVQVGKYAELQGISFQEAEKRVADARADYAHANNGAKTSLALVMKSFGYSVEESIEWRNSLIKPELFLSRDEELHELLMNASRRYRLICVTNNPLAVACRTLKTIGVDEFFPTVIGLDTCFKSKPAREPFLKALEILGLPAGECVSIGDRYDIDIAVPLQLGMGGVLVDGSKELPDIPFLKA